MVSEANSTKYLENVKPTLLKKGEKDRCSKNCRGRNTSKLIL